MNPHDQSIIHASDESDWRTPPACVAALAAEFGGFDLDAAANAASTVVPQAWFGPGSPLAENALLTSWDYTGFGTIVFLNPPYSRTKHRAYSTGRIKPKGAADWLPHPQDAQMARNYDVGEWAAKAWHESQKGVTVVAILPFAPQTEWYREYVYGHALNDRNVWSGHAAKEERRLPHRISFLRPDGSPAANAGVNSVVVVWTPMRGAVGPWMPLQYYWSYR